MKTTPVTAILASFLCCAGNTLVVADGMIHRLPKDGAWANFEMTGEGLSPTGEVLVTSKGTVTVKSVGREQVEGLDCRWIEIEIEREARSVRGQRSWRTEDFKLLIPEKYLVTGQNPREHVLKAWRKDLRGAVTELDLKGNDARTVQSLDELLNGNPAKVEKSEGVELKVPGGMFSCTRLDGKESSASGDADVEIKTWLTDEVPFGVAAYRHAMTRKKAEGPMGSRWMELKFAKSGTDAKSAIVPADKSSSKAE